jgi:dTDP-4-dehydrorhamnose 3,5-epimerase
MNIKNFRLKGAILIEPKTYKDDRGFFSEVYNQDDFSKIIGKKVNFVQDNYSKSKKNVLRGLHYQKNPKAQGKLIKVVSGEIFDVIVDIRKSSKTFKCWEGIELSSESNKQIWIPEGFAHGFLALTDLAEVVYKVTEYYSPEYECSIRYDDPKLNIDWPKKSNYFLSEKDKDAGFLEENTLFE